MATESFFSNASLAYLASAGAGKDGKTYSIKPTDGTGDFTFSRGSNLAATRVGPTGLIEKGRENLFTYSNQFDTAWLTSNASVTSGQSGYDGSNDAWLLSNTAAGGYLRETYTFTGLVTTTSVYAKAGSYDFLFLFSGGNWAYFDLVNGVVGTTSGSQLISSSIESVGDGWYRCSITHNFSGVSQLRFYPVIADNDLTGTSGNILIQDAQFEIGLAATDYIESGATTGKAGLLEDEPRFDYSGGATCPSLLLEGSRTNSLGQSEYFDGYTFTNSSIETNAATSPEGLTNATFLKEDTSTGIHLINENTTASAGVYTASVFAKANGRDWLAVNIAASGGYSAFFNLSNGTTGTIQSNITSATIEAVGTDGWYRCSITADTTTPAISPRIGIYLATGDNGFSYTGNGTNGIYIYGFQIEAGSYPTSYIPNHSGGSVTRTGESSIVMDVPNFTGSPSVSLFVDLGEWKGSDINNSNIYLSSASFSTQIQIRLRPDGMRVYLLNINGTDQYLNLGVTTASKILIKYDGNEYVLFINGVEIQTAASVGDSKYEKLYFNGYSTTLISKLLLFPEALSDADCISLTTL